MGERLGLERELALLRADDDAAAQRADREREVPDRYERGASAPDMFAPHGFGPAGFARGGDAPPVREREVTTADVGGYFDSVERARADALKAYPSRKPLLDAVTLRMVIQRDRLYVRVEGDTSTYVYPTQLSNSTAGFYYVEWNARCNLSRIIALKSGQPATKKEWSDPVLGGEQEVREQRCQRKGLVWVTQTIGKASAEPPDQFPLWNYPSLTSEEAKAVIQESPTRPLIAVGERRTTPGTPAFPSGQKSPPSLTITGITGGIFESGRYEPKPLDFTYWTHDGSHALLSRAYLCNDKDKKQCVDFYYLVPVGDIEDFLRFYPLAAAGKAAQGMVLLWQIVMEIGVYFIPVIGPIWGLVQTTKGVIDAYKNWDKMKGWEKALVGLDVLMTGVPGGKAVFKGVKGVRKVEEGTEALVKAGLPRADARRLMVSSAVLQSEKKTLQAVEHLGETLRKGAALTVDEMLQVEKAYNAMLKAIPAGERALQQARMATRNLASAKEFFQDVTLAEVHLAGLRLLTPEILVTLRETAKSNSTLVKQVIASAGQSRDVAWGIVHLQSAVRPDHLTHIAASLGDDVMRQLGNGTIALSDDLAHLAKRPRKLEDAYQTLMRGGTTTLSAGKKGIRVKVPGLASLLRDGRVRPLPQELAALEKNFLHTFLTEGQLRGLARLDSALQKALAKGAARDADLHRILTTAAQWPEAAALLNDLGKRLMAAKSARLNVPAVLGRLDPGFVQLIAKSGARLPDDLVRQAAQQSDSYEALKILLEGVIEGKVVRAPGIYDTLADAMKTHPDPIAALAAVHNRPHAGQVFSRWAVANPDRVKGVATVIALRTKDARDKVMDIYLGFPNDYQTMFKTIGEIHDKSRPGNLDKMIGNLATAAITKGTPETALGATLVLAYANKHLKPFNKDVVQMFERDLRKTGYNRVVDLVLGEYHVEFKFWSHFEGRQVLAAEKEFAQDLLYAIANKDLGLKNLRWVFSSNMQGYKREIVTMMENVVMKNADVAAALAKQGMKDPGMLRDALRRATDESTGWLVQFFGV